MTDFTMKTGDDGVAIITWDVQDRSMNVLSLEGWDALDDCVTRALQDDAVKGIVITSGKKDFAGGMDLNIIAKMKASAGDEPAKGLFDGLMRCHGILRKIERAGMDPKTLKGGKPIAAALPGTALGIGLEIPLACHRIFAADNHEGQDRPARNHGWYLSRHGRDHARQPVAGRDAGKSDPAGREAERSQEGQKCGPDPRGRGRPRRRRTGMGAEREGWGHRQAVGPEGLQISRRRTLFGAGFHDLRRRIRDGQRQDQRRLSRRQGASVGRL